MIKLKNLLKESTWANRKFGEPLPTMADYKKLKEGGPGSGPQGDDEDNPYYKEPSDDDLAAIEKEFEGVNEASLEKVKLPATVNRFLTKFVDSMKDANLNRIKRSAILYKVINASGMSPQQLMADIAKIKKELK